MFNKNFVFNSRYEQTYLEILYRYKKYIYTKKVKMYKINL